MAIRNNENIIRVHNLGQLHGVDLHVIHEDVTLCESSGMKQTVPLRTFTLGELVFAKEATRLECNPLGSYVGSVGYANVLSKQVERKGKLLDIDAVTPIEILPQHRLNGYATSLISVIEQRAKENCDGVGYFALINRNLKTTLAANGYIEQGQFGRIKLFDYRHI
jgi:GNAT superfamily N-acetyltransferase